MSPVARHEKASIIRRGQKCQSIPTALQLHQHCTVIIDEEATSQIENADFYRWIFQNEPEWAESR